MRAPQVAAVVRLARLWVVMMGQVAVEVVLGVAVAVVGQPLIQIPPLLCQSSDGKAVQEMV